jgi:hypothetical protein
MSWVSLSFLTIVLLITHVGAHATGEGQLPRPTEFESYLNHASAHVTIQQEIARFESGDKWMAIIALAIGNDLVSPEEMKGVSFAVQYEDLQDHVYLSTRDLEAFLKNLSGLQKIHEAALQRDRGNFLHTGNCMPSQAYVREHDLCVNYYQGKGTYGLRLHTLPDQHFIDLRGREPGELLDAIQRGLELIEN